MKKAIFILVFLGFSIPSFSQNVDGVKALGDEHWDSAFDSLNSPNGPVFAIAVADTNVYIGGSFSEVGGVLANNIARWDGHQWFALGEGVNNGGGPPAVYALLIRGSDLFAGGNFYSAGTEVASNIARWDGLQWHSLSTGANNYVRALAADGEGNLYAGGDFTTIGGVSNCGFVAMWDGSQWNVMDSGLGGNGALTHVMALAAQGPEVFAGGYFSLAGGDSASNLAVWNGTSWAPCGSGTSGEVFALDYFSPYLYVGGDFLTAGGVSARHITKYIAGGFMDISGGVDDVAAALDYGIADIFVASGLSLLPANFITKFDCCWDPLGSGVDSTVLAIAANGNDVWVGGNFSTAGGKESVHFGHWNPNLVFAEVLETPLMKGALYPNPGTGKFSVSLPETLAGPLRIQIFGVGGNLVFSADIEEQTGIFNFDLSHQTDGLYFFSILGGTANFSGKFLKVAD